MAALEIPWKVTRWQSPHFTPGRKGTVELVVIHAISLPPGVFNTGYVIDLFLGRLDPWAHPSFEELKDLRVSSHFFVERDGSIHQFVDSDDTAWHAGKSEFRGRENCNDFSVGVELEGALGVPFTERQYRALEAILQGLIRRYPKIPPHGVVGHEHISPGRKWDPGPSFDWARVLDAVQRIVLNLRGSRGRPF